MAQRLVATLRRSRGTAQLAVVVSTLSLLACDLVPARRCDDDADCGNGGSCNTTTGTCETSGIEVLSPLPGSFVGTDATTIRARLTFGGDALPGSLIFSTDLGESIVLNADENGEFTGTWAPTVEGVRQVTISADGGLTTEPFALTVDLTPPTFQLSFGSPGDRTAGNGFSNREGNSWKRDEIAVGEVSSTDTIDPLSVTYSLFAVIEGNPGPSTPNRAVSPDGGTPNLYRAALAVDLSEPEFEGFRGNIFVKLDGRDLAGNAGTLTTSIPVTRFKWTREFPFSGRQMDPAIASDGTLWTGVSDGGDGRIYRIAASGTAMTEIVARGLVGGVLIAAHPTDTRGGVYFLANDSPDAVNPDGGFLKVIPASTNAVLPACGPYEGGVHPQLALIYGSDPGGSFEQSVAFGAREEGGKLVAARMSAGFTCPSQDVNFNPAPGVDWGAELFSLYATEGSATTRWLLTPSTWVPANGWPAASTEFTSIAPRSPDVFGTGLMAGTGGLYVLSPVGALRGSAVTGPQRARAAAYDSSWRAIFGNGAGALIRASRTGVEATVAVDAGVTPVLGADGTIYASEPSGRLVVMTSSFEEKWSLPDAGADPGPMLLDCARQPDGGLAPGRPGILYVPSGAGLTAIIVDSRGLDPNAGWPRARHDNGNTASSTTIVSPCP